MQEELGRWTTGVQARETQLQVSRCEVIRVAMVGR